MRVLMLGLLMLPGTAVGLMLGSTLQAASALRPRATCTVRTNSPYACDFNFDEESERDDEPIDLDMVEGIPIKDIDWDEEWVLYRVLQGAYRRNPAEQIIGAVVVVMVISIMLKIYIVKTGGLVIVPDHGPGLGLYNFRELDVMDASHLQSIGLPMRATMSPVQRWFFH